MGCHLIKIAFPPLPIDKAPFIDHLVSLSTRVTDYLTLELDSDFIKSSNNNYFCLKFSQYVTSLHPLFIGCLSNALGSFQPVLVGICQGIRGGN
jgi:hypothetical protein